MKKFLFALLTATIIFASCAFAQQTSSSVQASSVVPKDQQATREDIVALMDVMHSKRQSTAMLDAMKQQMAAGMNAGFTKEHPNASPELLKKFDATMDGAWSVLNVDEILAAAIPVYQKYLSHEDVVSLISFYSSPAGQHFLERMPALLKESAELGGNIVKGHMEEIQSKTQAAYAQFEKYLADHPEELGAPAKSSEN